jgi:hypothetical protein
MDCGSIGIPASATASPALPDLIDRYEALVTKSEEQAWRHVIQGGGAVIDEQRVISDLLGPP